MSGSTAGVAPRDTDVPPVSSHQGERGFRADVEGIRALAVLVVLLYHAKVPGISGGFVGVDIFFVVSGFLITGLLLREVSTTGRIRFARFYARRAKRLLPAGTLVLAVTALGSWLLLPASRWPAISVDISAAALFVVNWVFADRSTDYLGAEEAASPVQHFWSLSVEEQFYFVWPALLAVFAVLAVRTGVRVRRSLLAAMALVLGPSLIYSVWATTHNPSGAYFSTLTRLWEMALGGLLALTAVEARRLPGWIRSTAGWAGVAAVLASVLLITDQTPFPGKAALLPTVGAAALLLAGMGADGGSVTRGLSVRPMVWVGGMSYSLYLWHWPAIAIVSELRPEAGWRLLLPVTGVTCVLAWLSLRLLENPVRHAAVFRRRSGMALVMGAGLIAVSLTCAGLLHRVSGAGQSGGTVEIPLDRLGAAVLLDTDWVDAHPDPGDSFDPLVPSVADAPDDNAAPYSDGCQLGSAASQLVECQYGDPDAEFQIVIAGDSHATSWVPTLTRLAQDNGWGLRTMLKSQCPLTDSQITLTPDAKAYEACAAWQEQARSLLADSPPDILLITSVNYVGVLDDSGRRLEGAERTQEIQRGFRTIAQEVASQGTTPVFIADVPLMRREGKPFKVPDCVAEHGDTLSECAVPRAEAVDELNPVDRMLSADQEFDWNVIDLNDGICLPEICPAVVGNVIVYRDYAHLTKTYAQTMAPWMAEALGPWTPDPVAADG